MRKANMISACLGAVVFFTAAPVMALPDAESLSIGRCSVPEDVSVYSRSSSMFPLLQSFSMDVATVSNIPLPALMVDGWHPKPSSLEKALAELGSESGFTVKGSGFQMVEWSGKSAPLSQVVSVLAKQAGADWSFDGSVLSLSRQSAPSLNSSASVALPSSRDARLAFLDIVRGHGLGVVVNGERAVLSGPSSSFAKTSSALSSVSQLLVFDVAFMRGRPSEGRYNWNSLGASESLVSNAGGRFAFAGMSLNSVISTLRQRGDVIVEGKQTVAAPEGWSLAVPQGQCGSGSGEMIIKPRFTGDTLSLGIQGAGLSAQYNGFNLGSVALVASSAPVNGWIQMALIRPRIVAFKR